MRKVAFFLFFVIIVGTLAACNTLAPAPTNTPTATNTPTPTATYTPSPTSTPTITPTPTPVPLEGRLFWDMDENGTPSEAAFRWDQTRLNSPLNKLERDYMSTHPNMFFDSTQIAELEGMITKYIAENKGTLQDEFNPIMLKALDDYAKANPNVKQGDLVKLDEPKLPGYGVCVLDDCVQTDSLGRFAIPDKGTGAGINIKDPYADVIAWMMRFIDKWNGPVTIPAYTQDLDAAIVATMYDTPSCAADAAAQVCKQDADTVLVREQHLNDTEVVPLNRATPIKIGQPNDIGLMQGYLVLPFMFKDNSKLTKILGFDHDPSPGKVLRWDGSTLLCPDYRTCSDGIWDGHDGVDFFVPDGTLITASFPSVIVEEEKDPRANQPRVARLDSNLILMKQGYYPELILGHHSASMVQIGEQLYPGQITLLSNHTGTSTPHLHLGLVGVKISSGKRTFLADPYGVIADPTTESDRYSAWTVYNLPIYPK